jgi:hypothetical protein
MLVLDRTSTELTDVATALKTYADVNLRSPDDDNLIATIDTVVADLGRLATPTDEGPP